MRDAFGKRHPIVNFVYFLWVLIFSMVFMHPVCLMISLLVSVSYAVYLNGNRTLRLNFLYMLPLMLFTMVINCLFNHRGLTTLLYLPDGNPLTLEAVFYGVAASVMLAAVINWFSCLNTVITSDKIVYLFGRILPTLSLIFSMVFRFVPRFHKKMKEISIAQQNIGYSTGDGNLSARIRHGIAVFSVVVTWALESAVETADSMKSRGYGLPGRTSFSLYRMDKIDIWMLLLLLLCGVYVFIGGLLGGLFWRYYPTFDGKMREPYTISIYCVYGILCAAPMILEWMEGRKWNAIKLKI